MAILDRRLIPFLEMLAEIGLDWLVFELVDGIRRGRESEESAEALLSARKHVHSGKIELAANLSKASNDVEPLAGDEQLDWVARYVSERLEAVIAGMTATLDNINEIVEQDKSTRLLQAKRENYSKIILLDGERQLEVDRLRVTAALGQLPKLREALTSWVANAQKSVP